QSPTANRTAAITANGTQLGRSVIRSHRGGPKARSDVTTRTRPPSTRAACKRARNPHRTTASPAARTTGTRHPRSWPSKTCTVDGRRSRSSPPAWASQLDGTPSAGERRVHPQPRTSAAIAGGTVYAAITPPFQAPRDVHSAAGITRPPMTARKRRPGRTAPARAMTPRRARASATRPVRACAPMTVNSAISAHRPAGTSAASKSGVRNRGATTATPAVSAMTANAAYSADSPAARGEVNTAPPVAAVATAVLPTATGTDRANAAATAQTTAVNSKTPTVVYCSTDAQLNPRPSVHSPVSAGNQGAVTVAG